MWRTRLVALSRLPQVLPSRVRELRAEQSHVRGLRVDSSTTLRALRRYGSPGAVTIGRHHGQLRPEPQGETLRFVNALFCRMALIGIIGQRCATTVAAWNVSLVVRPGRRACAGAGCARA